MSDSVTFGDVRAAEARLKGLVAVTPCPHSETLSQLTRARVFVKLENPQMTGSFKERGAANVLLLAAGYTVEEVRHPIGASASPPT